MTEERIAALRAVWWRIIRDVSPDEARMALLQILVDMEEHWGAEHPDDGPFEDLGIPPDEYLAGVIERVRRSPPPEARTLH